MGCSRGVPGLFRGVPGAPRMFRVFQGCSGGVPGFADTLTDLLQHPEL